MGGLRGEGVMVILALERALMLTVDIKRLLLVHILSV